MSPFRHTRYGDSQNIRGNWKPKKSSMVISCAAGRILTRPSRYLQTVRISTAREGTAQGVERLMSVPRLGRPSSALVLQTMQGVPLGAGLFIKRIWLRLSSTNLSSTKTCLHYYSDPATKPRNKSRFHVPQSTLIINRLRGSRLVVDFV